jgi:hypothetical protein
MFSIYKDNMEVCLNQQDIERKLCARTEKQNVVYIAVCYKLHT